MGRNLHGGSKSDSSAAPVTAAAAATVECVVGVLGLQVQGGRWQVPKIHSLWCECAAKSKEIKWL